MFNANLLAKQNGAATQNHLIIVEHTPVYTLGKNGKKENLLFDPAKIGADFHEINRGGDITFHGPGQLTIYPIVDLENLQLGVADFVFKLEEVVIQLLDKYNLKGFRIKEAAGVWLTDGFTTQKICAVGLKMSRYLTMHGIAINVNTNLKFFQYIVPCGITDKGVTSFEKELGKKISLTEISNLFIAIFEKEFAIKFTND